MKVRKDAKVLDRFDRPEPRTGNQVRGQIGTSEQSDERRVSEAANGRDAMNRSGNRATPNDETQLIDAQHSK